MDLLRSYLIVINAITFTMRGLDKRKAVGNQRRISEKSLLVLSALGGWAGGYLAMQTFRHKTLKGAFLWKFWLIVIVRITILTWLMYNTGQ